MSNEENQKLTWAYDTTTRKQTKDEWSSCVHFSNGRIYRMRPLARNRLLLWVTVGFVKTPQANIKHQAKSPQGDTQIGTKNDKLILTN